ncbi:MAG: 4-hydroxy-tetrahydrodipicolinate reductase [Eubacteriales bacterium]|jgi:4-hydroxy-tetrahydrodipicolinate reductase|nr:4-hydroxy-tetrahydrodipicolinate reductase [Eubacteriales bacterium]
MSIKAIVHGAGGHMGQILCRLLIEHDAMELADAVDPFGGTVEADGRTILKSLDEITQPADVIIDFSHHSCCPSLMAYAEKKHLPVVLCTTGITEEEQKTVEQAAKSIAVFQSGNMSVGIALLRRLAREAAQIMEGCDIEIVEAHHNRKLDAPSGTALMLADEIKKVRPEAEYVLGRAGEHKRTPQEIGISSLRMGNVVGDHTVILATENQSITIQHHAQDRALFADGAITAAKFLIKQKPGIYDMDDML